MLDIVLAVIFIGAAITGFRKGFLKSLIGLFGNIAALIASYKLSASVALQIDAQFGTAAMIAQKIRGILPQYGGKVDVVDFYATSPNVISAVSSYWSEKDTVKINGKLNFTSKVEEKMVEVDFGEPRMERRTVSVSELIITGGTQTPLDGDFAFDEDEINEALKERQANLAAKKEKAKEKDGTKKAAPAKKGFSDLGF